MNPFQEGDIERPTLVPEDRGQGSRRDQVRRYDKEGSQDGDSGP